MNRFFSFEGVDGSGKSTLARLVAERTGGVVYHSSPERMRPYRHAVRKQSPLIQYIFFIIGNHISSKEIADLLRKSDVIADRYVHSTLSHYSLYLGEMDEPRGILMPEKIIYVSAPWEEIDGRLKRRGKRDAHESLGLLKRIDEQYQRLFSGREDVLWVWNPNSDAEEKAERIAERLRQVF